MTKPATPGAHFQLRRSTALGSYLSLTLGAGAASLLNAEGAIVSYTGSPVTVNAFGDVVYWDPVLMTAATAHNAGEQRGVPDCFSIRNQNFDYAYTERNCVTINTYFGLADPVVFSGTYPVAKDGGGVTIDSNTYWFGNTWAYMSKSGWTTADSPWATGLDGTTGYIPFMFSYKSDPSSRYYGWADITYNPVAGSITLNGFAYNDTANAAITTSAVPEPSGILLLAMGGTAALLARRRKEKQAAEAAA